MLNSTQGAARVVISGRLQLDAAELVRLQASRTLVSDERRRRPLYFDGRFLAASDLTSEQNYFLTRQSDLGRAGGSGVVHGLAVRSTSSSMLEIDAGHGVTPSGEGVVLPEPLQVDVTNIPQIQQLDAAFGLLRVPNESVRNATGLYIIALRPVEFSANPIASYPTSINGPRTAQDGDMIEGVAATLIPYPDGGGEGALDHRRALAARTIFVEGGTRGFPVDALPLAMIGLDRGVVKWVDDFLVRREVGATHGDVLGLGLAPRAVREAYLFQYDNHLAEILAQRDTAKLGRRFAASDYFVSLPSGGRLPAGVINAADFTQSFFPPEVRVDLSIVPAEEVQALLEESLRLPPIDLTQDGEALESTAVLVLAPVPMARVRSLTNALERLTRALPPAAPGLVAQRRPLAALREMRIARMPQLPAPVLTVDSAWRGVVSDAAANGGLLWYVRRRNLDYRRDLAGVSLRVPGDDGAAETAMVARLTALGLVARFTALVTGTSTLAHAELVTLLASPHFLGGKDPNDAPTILTRAAVAELEAKQKANGAKPLTRALVQQVEERFADPDLGTGLTRLVAASTDIASTKGIDGVVASLQVPEIDRAGRLLSETRLAELAPKLGKAAMALDTTQITTLLASVQSETHP